MDTYVMADDILLCIDEICAKLDICKATVYNLIHRKAFPAPLQIGYRTSRWKKSEIDTWLAEQPQGLRKPAKQIPIKQQATATVPAKKTAATAIPEATRQNGCSMKKGTLPPAVLGKVRFIPRPAGVRKVAAQGTHVA